MTLTLGLKAKMKKKFKVTIEPDVDRGEIVLEAETAEQAEELAEELFSEDPDLFVWPPFDCSGLDFCHVVSVEELKGKSHVKKT